MSNNIWVPMVVGSGIGLLRRKTIGATVVGGLSGIAVGIVMNILKGDPGLSGAGISHFRRGQQEREERLPESNFPTDYEGRVKYY